MCKRRTAPCSGLAVRSGNRLPDSCGFSPNSPGFLHLCVKECRKPRSGRTYRAAHFEGRNALIGNPMLYLPVGFAKVLCDLFDAIKQIDVGVCALHQYTITASLNGIRHSSGRLPPFLNLLSVPDGIPRHLANRDCSPVSLLSMCSIKL